MAKQLSVRLSRDCGISLLSCCEEIAEGDNQRISRIGMISAVIGCEGNEN